VLVGRSSQPHQTSSFSRSLLEAQSFHQAATSLFRVRMQPLVIHPPPLKLPFV